MSTAIVALVISVVLAAFLLTRQRNRHRPESDPNDPSPSLQPRRRLTRQERLLQKLEPLPEIPTVMDLVRAEIEETGVERIPGHEGLTGPVMLKVFRRDAAVRDRCTHEGFGFVIREGVEPEAATEDDVRLYCEQCGDVPGDSPEDELAEDSGTESDAETL